MKSSKGQCTSLRFPSVSLIDSVGFSHCFGQAPFRKAFCSCSFPTSLFHMWQGQMLVPGMSEQTAVKIPSTGLCVGLDESDTLFPRDGSSCSAAEG